MSNTKEVHSEPRLRVSLSTCYLEYGRHVARLRRRRAYAPTSNTASHDNHEKINSWVSFLFPVYGLLMGLPSAALRAAGAPLLPNVWMKSVWHGARRMRDEVFFHAGMRDWMKFEGGMRDCKGPKGRKLVILMAGHGNGRSSHWAMEDSGSYVWHMSCHTARLKYAEMINVDKWYVRWWLG